MLLRKSERTIAQPPDNPDSRSEKLRLVGSLLVTVLVLGGLVASLHREVLFRGEIYHMDDAADNYYPARVAFRRAVQEGTLPSWENDAMGGWPLLADPYYGYFYPPNFVFFLGQRSGHGEPDSGQGQGQGQGQGLAGGVAAGLGISAALHAFLAGIGMFLYLRARRPGGGLAWGAALFGAISFALSSFLVVRIRHIIFVQIMAWLPFLLWAIDRYLERFLESGSGRRWALFACALFTALLLLPGAHSLLHFVALVVVAYALARLAQTAFLQPVGKRLRCFLRASAWLALSGLAGILLSAVALLPTLHAMPYSARALGADYSFASSYAWPDWRFIKLLLQPDSLGIGEWRSAPKPWLGPWNHWELAGYYQGGLALLLALPGALTGLGRLRSIALDRLVLLGLCLLAVLIALGDAAPVHPFLFNHLPLYAALRCPARALCILVVAVPILAAYAADVAARSLPGRYTGPILLLGLCALTAADQYRIDRGYVQPKPIDYAQGTERFAAVEWLREHTPTSPAPPDRFLPDGRGPFRLLSVGETLGLPSASGYSSMLVWRYVHLLYIINHGGPYPYRQLRYDPAAARLLRFDSPLIDMLNVRYLISHEQPPTPAGKWQERFHPQPTPSWLPAGPRSPAARHEPIWDAWLRVYENTQVMPRAYVAYQARRARTEAEEAALVARPDFDPHREIVLGGSQEVAIENQGRAHGPAKLLSYQRHRVVIEAQVQAPAVLVLADTFFPGWSASVDGKDQPIRPVNLAQRGVVLTPGSHHIEFIYRDTALRWGFALSLCGLLILIGLVALPLRRS